MDHAKDSYSAESSIVQLFTEVKRHKPSVIYIPNVNTWYETVGSTAISTFLGLLRTLAPTDPVLLLGILECEESEVNFDMIRDLFGYSRKNSFEITRPGSVSNRIIEPSFIELKLRSLLAMSFSTPSLNI